MANPKLLQSITILTSNQDFAFTLAGAQAVEITLGQYDTIYEVASNFEGKLQAVNANFSVTVSALGIMVISNSPSSWGTNWAGTDDNLEDLFGYAGTESVAGAGPYTLTATKRHGQNSQAPPWYSPVGERYPSINRLKPRRVEPTDDGDASTHASGGQVKTIELSFIGVEEPALEPDKAAVSDDGSGGTIDWTGVTFGDWWLDTAEKKWRFYFRKDDQTVGGTVASPGTEGTDYYTCVHSNQELIFDPLDPDGFTYFNVTIPVQITGG
jgi:hypothetical protein